MTRFPPKRILVPFDFSAPSAAAWRRAQALARRFGAEVEVVHIRESPLAAELAAIPVPGVARSEKNALTERLRRAVGEGPKVAVVSGEPVPGILRQAQSHRADLIVMGTHGRTGLTRALLGSVAEAVVRRSPVPVWAVRGGAGEVRSVVAPVNFTDYSYYGFTYAASMASALDARLTALHVHVDPIWNGNPERKLQRLLESLPLPLRAACRPSVEHGESDATRGILKAGGAHDLIVLVAHEKSPALDAIMGTTAERVIRGASSSVLVVPAPRGSLPVRKDLPTACCAVP